MLESEFEDAVITAAQLGGWRVHAERPARTAHGGWRTAVKGDTGWPDLALAHPRRGLFVLAELKSESGRVRPEQRRWLDDLEAAGVTCRVWRPIQLGSVAQFLIDPNVRTVP